MPSRAYRSAPHRLRCLLAGCCLFSPALVAELPSGALPQVLNSARMTSWQNLLDSAGSDSESAKLQRVNSFINRSVIFVEDQQTWGVEDYWATPAETLSRGLGDCEDFAIAKYFSLVRMGVPSEKLRLTFVKALKQNQAHMVLTYYANPNAQPLILDNLDPRIRPASERSDLLPVYSFNDLGVFLAKAPQRVSQPPQFLARWSELSERAIADGSAPGAPRG